MTDRFPEVRTFQITVSLAVAAMVSLNAAPARAAPRPNVVFILVDDQGWTDAEYAGSDLYQTPHIDRLAKEGMRFDNAYAACTVCSPTRASLLTGLYPATIRVTDWIPGFRHPYAKLQSPAWTQRLEGSHYTLAEALQDAGYATAHIGKWHLGEDETDWPEYHGFDKNIGGWRMGQPNHDDGGNGYFSPYANPRLSNGPEGEYLGTRLGREASAFIEEHCDQPFFLNLWFYLVHTPLQAEADKVAHFQNRVREGALHHNATYAAMVEHMDDAVGMVLDALDRLGLKENTIVIFTSDNGGLIGNRGNTEVRPSITSNFPLRNGKGDVYEGGVRVPLIVRYPHHVAAGSVSSIPVTSPDFYPTLLDLTRVNPRKKTPKFDGVSLAGLLVGGETDLPREAIFWHYPHYHTEGATPYSAIRKGAWKLIEFFEDGRVELYHLATDIGEQSNLAETNLAKRNELLADLRAWRKRVGAQLPRPNPAHDPTRAGEFQVAAPR